MSARSCASSLPLILPSRTRSLGCLRRGPHQSDGGALPPCVCGGASSRHARGAGGTLSPYRSGSKAPRLPERHTCHTTRPEGTPGDWHRRPLTRALLLPGSLNVGKQAWTGAFLVSPPVLGSIDTYGIELIHLMREGCSPQQIGRKGLANHLFRCRRLWQYCWRNSCKLSPATVAKPTVYKRRNQCMRKVSCWLER
jgi:hypothetical protein